MGGEGTGDAIGTIGALLYPLQFGRASGFALLKVLGELLGRVANIALVRDVVAVALYRSGRFGLWRRLAGVACSNRVFEASDLILVLRPILRAGFPLQRTRRNARTRLGDGRLHR